MIIVANALHIPLGDKTVQCVVTSPPYWGLRDYGISGQLGLEPTPEEYVENIVSVFREVWRVLKDDGVLWLNLGDSFNAKDLCGIPWRVVFALQSNDWYLRSDIIWAKPNPMPESVKDRCTSSHEHIFMLTKNQRYYYDADAIREQGIGGYHDSIESRKARALPEHKSMPDKIKSGIRPDKQRGHGRRHAGFNDRWDSMSKEEQTSVMRNKRDVWNIATRPYPDAHYAVFPEEIPRTCILASSRVGDTVLDPFGGSGTTGKVAIELGRKAICMDISKEYVHKHMKARMQTTIGMF